MENNQSKKYNVTIKANEKWNRLGMIYTEIDGQLKTMSISTTQLDNIIKLYSEGKLHIKNDKIYFNIFINDDNFNMEKFKKSNNEMEI